MEKYTGVSMLLRLLALFYLLFLSQGLIAQRSVTATTDAIPATCAVTKPYQTSLFVPPLPYEAKLGSGQFWFGTDRLWTNLPVNGMWKGLPLDTSSSHPTFSQKLFLWRQGYDGRMEPRPKLTVTGKRLDTPAPPLEVSRPTTAIMGHRSAMLVGLGFPTVGCWQITGRYEDDELSFVIWVAR